MDILRSVGKESSRLASNFVHDKTGPLIARLGQLLGIDESNIKVTIVKIAGITVVTVSVLYLG